MPKRRLTAKVEPPEPPPSPRPTISPNASILAALLVFALLLIVYQQTVLRTAVDQDSGEYVAAVHVQGIPHPTGYPLWLLLGRLFDCLPLGGTSAYRVGIMNAVWVAGAGAAITLTALALTGQILPSILAGLAFGLWSPPWGDSVRAMVHALSGLLVALCIVALRRWNRDRTAKALLLLSLAVGVAAMHHRVAFLAAGPALAAAFVLTRPRRAGTYLPAAALFFAPFSLYGYLWYRALQHPPVYWTDVTTFPRLMQHIVGHQYTQFAFQHGGEEAVAEVQKMIPQLLAGPGPLSVLMGIGGVALILWGWSIWWRREPLVAGFLAAGTALVLIWVSQWGESSDLKHFLSPIGPPLALAGALGAAQLSSLRAVKQFPWAPAALVGAVICGGLLRANWPEYNFSDRWGNRDRWAAALRQMEPNAVFVSDFDQPNFVTIYLQNVEKLRPDIILLRGQRLNDPADVAMIRDPEVRDAARTLGFPNVAGELAMHQATARFAYELAKRLPKRPIYAVHGPLGEQLPGPPYFLNLSMDLVRLTMTAPTLAQKAAGPSEADFPNGCALIGFVLDRTQARTGDMVGFIARWRLSQTLVPSQFVVALLPPYAGSDRRSQPVQFLDPAQLAGVVKNEDVRLFQPFLFGYGQWGLPPSPEGTVYEQRGAVIIPSNAPAGEYHFALAISQPYVEQPDQFEGWTTVPLTLQVTARPLPRNGP
jgi:hypothetical protein